MRIPTRLVIKDQEWKIVRKWAPRIDGHCVDGYADDRTKTICIAMDLHGNELTRVFFHEAMHALFYELGIQNTKVSSEVEEILVEGIASWLTQTFEFRRKR